MKFSEAIKGYFIVRGVDLSPGTIDYDPLFLSKHDQRLTRGLQRFVPAFR